MFRGTSTNALRSNSSSNAACSSKRAAAAATRTPEKPRLQRRNPLPASSRAPATTTAALSATSMMASLSSTTLSLQAALSAHWLALSGAALATYFVFRLFRFARADADASLLSARAPPPDAYLGKSVWITGASQGLGARLALEYYRLGAHVVLSSRSEEKLRAVAAAVVRVGGGAKEERKALPPPPTVLPFDALAPYAKLEEVALKAAEASRETWTGWERKRSGDTSCSSQPLPPPPPPALPRLSLLVLCAGASQHAAAAATTAEVSDAILELNAAAPIRLTRAALPHLLETLAAAAKTAAASGGEQRGQTRKARKATSKRNAAHLAAPAASVLGVSSMAALVPSPGQAAYSASKAALALYLRSVEAELFDTGFRTTTVYPGPLTCPSRSPPSSTSASEVDEGDEQVFSAAAVRTVYGSSGLRQEGAEAASSKAKEDKKRLDGARAAALIVTAGFHGLGEALLGKHPVLLLGHLARGGSGGGGISHALLRRVLGKVGPARAAALEEGRGGYDAGALLSSSAAAASTGKKQA